MSGKSISFSTLKKILKFQFFLTMTGFGRPSAVTISPRGLPNSFPTGEELLFLSSLPLRKILNGDLFGFFMLFPEVSSVK